MAGESQYLIKSAIITSDRFSPNASLNVAGMIAELNIFESIEIPYLTASMIMVDDAAIYDTVGIYGTERISFEISHPSNRFAPIRKDFMITGIEKSRRTNERTEVNLITMIEEHAYLSNVKKFSKAFTSKPDKIIQNILKGELNKDLDSRLLIESSQGDMTVVIPYLQPLKACEWIRDRMTTPRGSPYFFFSSLRNNNLHLADMELLMSKRSVNENTPYIYSQSTANSGTESADIQNLFYVQALKTSKIESGLLSATRGSIGSNFSVTDLASGLTYRTKHNGAETVKAALENIRSITGDDYKLTLDTSLEIGGKNIVDHSSLNVSQVVTTRGYDNSLGYHDEIDASFYKTKIQNMALRSILMRNVVNIVVPGLPFLINSESGVGSNIDLEVMINTQDEDSLSAYDEKKSGKYLVYDTRHTFKSQRHDVSMNIVKLANKGN